MPCDTQYEEFQTVTERKEEVRKAATAIDKLIAAKTVTIKVGPQGAITFVGLSDDDRKRMTDGCIYRRIMATGSTASKMAIMRAEQLAGRAVDRKVVAQGLHSHDGGSSWHPRG